MRSGFRVENLTSNQDFSPQSNSVSIWC